MIADPYTDRFARVRDRCTTALAGKIEEACAAIPNLSDSAPRQPARWRKPIAASTALSGSDRRWVFRRAATRRMMSNVRAPSFLVWASDAFAVALPNGCPGATMTFNPSSRSSAAGADRALRQVDATSTSASATTSDAR